MSNIEKSEDKVALTKKEIESKIFEEYNQILNVGDRVWSEHNGRGTVVDIQEKTIIVIFDEDQKKFEDFAKKGEEYKYLRKPYSYHDFFSLGYCRRLINEETFNEDVHLLLNGQITSQELVEREFGKSKESNSTELMIMNKEILIHKKNELIIQKQFLATRIKRAEELLESRKRYLAKFADELGSMLSKLNRLIYTIELYLGVNEELHHLQQGKNGSGAIHFRQRLLYMDIEVGDPMDDLKGLDFTNINHFDEWLLKTNTYWNKKNYEILIPEEKCVVIFKIRKEDKRYTNNPWINSLMNQDNKMTYILIRNGENVFRIWADIIIGKKLFPDSDEYTKEADYFEQRTREENLERYKMNMVLMQGIIERTICFPDEQHTVSLFKNYTDKQIKFVYDADWKSMLPSGIKSFKDWWKEKANTIVEGSRVFYLENMLSDRSEIKYHFIKDYQEYSIPDLPQTGVYLAEKVQKGVYNWKKNETEKVEYLAFKYLPNDERRPSWGEDWYDADLSRKNRVSFKINYCEDYCIDYDSITREDLKLLEFYENTRIGREHYLTIIPAIKELRKQKLKEIQQEDDFIRLILKVCGLDPTDSDFFQLGLMGAEWWKTKNKWKRFLNSDNDKAYRMIVKYINKMIDEN